MLIAETNAERGAFICSRCEQQTMKLIDCLCERCSEAVKEPLCIRCGRKRNSVMLDGQSFIGGFCEECWNFMHPQAEDLVNHPPHYTNHPSGVECIQITEHMGFCLGNAVKYIWRADLKADAIEDLKKAAWYIAREIEKREQL